jgi:hypothetical protein
VREHDPGIVEHGLDPLDLVVTPGPAQEQLLHAQVQGQHVAGGERALQPVEGRVVPVEDADEHLLGLGFQVLGQVLFGEGAALHQQSAQVLPRGLLAGQRVAERRLGDPPPGHQEVAEAIGGLVGSAGGDPAVPEKDALGPLAPDQLERTRFAHRRDPLQEVRQRHRGQRSLE